jgi:hypothetical protein
MQCWPAIKLVSGAGSGPSKAVVVINSRIVGKQEVITENRRSTQPLYATS